MAHWRSVSPEISGNFDADGFRRLDLRVEHIGVIDSFPWFHRDPFERALIAQGMSEEFVAELGRVVDVEWSIDPCPRSAHTV